MKLITKEVENKFLKYPIGSQDGKGKDALVIAKFFNPCGAGTWLITEAEKDGDDWCMFGYCNITDWEWGYVMLSELISVKLPFGLTVERDMHVPDGATVGSMVKDYE